VPNILLTSVFKPFGVDNVFSRRESKIELFHNQLNQQIFFDNSILIMLQEAKKRIRASLQHERRIL